MSELSRCISETQMLTESLKIIFIQGWRSLSTSFRLKVNNNVFVKLNLKITAAVLKKCFLFRGNFNYTLLPSEESNRNTSPSLKTRPQVAAQTGLNIVK